MDEFFTSTFGQVSYFILLGVVIAALIVWAYRRITARHHAAMDVARFLTAWGFQRTPKFLEYYALSDWPAATHELKELRDVLNDPAKRDIEFMGLFKRMLESRLADSATRQQTLDLIAKLTAPVPAQKAAA